MTAAVYEIPLTAQAQQFQIPMNGVTYTLRVTWCDPQGAWMLDIFTADEVPILLAIPIQPGDNILGQHEYLGIGGQMWVQVDGDGNAVPDFEGLGTAGHLYYITP